MESLIRRIARKLTCRFFRLAMNTNWSLLKYYPAVTPDQNTLDRWQDSEWDDYAEWISRNAIMNQQQWVEQYKLARQSRGNVNISIITPTYNTDPAILKECILSIRTQTSPFWELILVDDGSNMPHTLEVLSSPLCQDPRIRVLLKQQKDLSGISAATNRGIDIARGDYIAFLDHDDRLAPEAIQKLILAIESDSEIDIVYSDRDMLSLGGKRFMHLMKPDWSPENLYGGNYIFHLMCYRKDLIIKAGGLRSDYDGSQDYDLILRCMELNPKVKHLPYVLYHWRQSEKSVSLEEEAKDFAFEAGMAALRDALKRRGIDAKVTENKSLWRGNYQIELQFPASEDIGEIALPTDLKEEDYTSTIMNDPVWQKSHPFVFVNWQGYAPYTEQSLFSLASWLELDHIGIASGRIVEHSNKIIYAGMFFDKKGKPIAPYAGKDASEPGYLAVTQSARNISAPNPMSFIIKKELWLELNGLDPKFKGIYALFDMALSSLKKNWRIVYVPMATYTSNRQSLLESSNSEEHGLFFSRWSDWLEQGDPYYSTNLKNDSRTYELA